VVAGTFPFVAPSLAPVDVGPELVGGCPVGLVGGDGVEGGDGPAVVAL
jgi:hypothetical protein